MKASGCETEGEIDLQNGPETKIVPQLKMDPPIVIVCNSKLRKWAAKNALTLFFGNLYFIITWAVIILAAKFK